ncbi:MAG: o-succinylbenzoate synthase [Candidatus Brachytrichaceae bacterium NZ_4S206]|jgi:O-succinylbenzoate synthase
MNIERIELFHIRIPLVAPFETSFGVTTERESTLVRITADGVTGWGESVADADPGYSYETVTTNWHVMTGYLIPALFSAPIGDPREAPARFSRVRGHNMAKAALEAALWDIAAQQAGLSLRDYIGKVTGRQMKDRIVVGVSIGIQPTTERLLERIESFLKYGYLRIKMKIKPGRDLQDVRAARTAFPDRMLMVDANSAYTLQDAELFKQMDDLNLLMIEQPLGYDDIYEHSKLQPQLRTPICLDESIHTPDHARMAIELGACKIINIKQGRVGGLTQAIAVHDICEAHGVPVWCGGMLETGIGRALNLALAALPNFTLPSDLSASNRYYNPDMIEPPFEINDDGTLSVPTGLGLGINVVPERLRKITLRHEVFGR